MRIKMTCVVAAMAAAGLNGAALGQCDDSVTSTFEGGNGHRGAMFDLTVLNPDGITITSFDFNARSGTSGPAEIEVYYVTDRTSYVGKHNDRDAWTLMGRASLPSINPTGTPTPVPIGGLTINFGETVGIYFTRSDGISIEYSNGPLGAFENRDVRWEDRGMGGEYPFLLSFDNRIWNGTVYYDCGAATGPTIALSGSCPGTMRLSWSGAEPGRPAGVAIASGTGNFVIPGGPCAGTQLGLNSTASLLTPPGQFSTGPNGEGSFSGNAGGGACGRFLQMVVFQSGAPPCETSNVVQIN